MSQIKNAIIRGKMVRECPMGLPIPEACQYVGKAIDRMSPCGDNEKLKKANILVYAYEKGCFQCSYAQKIMNEQSKVDCNFGDTAEGFKSQPFSGSPLYPSTFVGIGLDGLYGYPLGFWADNNESRSLFFGLFSYLGAFSVEQMIKQAEEYDKCSEVDKSEILDNLLNKLKGIREEYRDTFDKIQTYLMGNRLEYEDNRQDTGKKWQLLQQWFGSRQSGR